MAGGATWTLNMALSGSVMKLRRVSHCSFRLLPSSTPIVLPLNVTK